MKSERENNVLIRCVNIASDGAEITHVWRKTVPEVRSGNWKSLFADGGEVVQTY